MTTSTPTQTNPETPDTRDRRFAQRSARPAKFKARHLLVGAVLLGLLLAAVGFSYFRTYEAPLQEPMVRVNENVFTLRDYVTRLRHLQAEGKLLGQPVNFSTDPFRLLEDLVAEELILQGSPRMGVTVSEDEITQELRTRFGTILREQDKLTEQELQLRFQELLRQRLNDVNLTEAQYRILVRNSLLRQKLRERLEARVPAVAEQIRVEGFRAQDQNVARQLADQWRKGTNIIQITLAEGVSPESREQRGDMGWLPKRGFDPGVDEAIWKLPIGEITDPFFTGSGQLVVRVVEGPTVRAVEGNARERLKDRAVEDWLEEERKANRVERYFDSKRYDYVVNKVREYLR